MSISSGAKSSFYGERLAEAREARGYNRAQVAEALGITRQAISQYEKSIRSPTSSLRDNAAQFLRFPVHRFAMPMPERLETPQFFRSLAAATKTARTRAARRLDWVREDVSGYLRKFIDFPAVNFPEFEFPGDPAMLDHEDIELIARETRRRWGMGDGPIADVVMVLENNGAVVVRQELGLQTLDAFSRWDAEDGRPYIVLGTDKDTAVRSRYNAAHELGHMILHRHLSRNQVFHTNMHDVLEEQAHYFAGAFLLPAETFKAEIFRPSLQGFLAIKTRWRVSIGAMIRRAKNLGIISEAEEERLFTYRSQRGWAKKEPYDDELKVERPKFIERSFDLLLRQGITTREGVESELAMFAPDIESATGLEPGFFGDDVEHFKFPKLSPTDPNDPPPDNYTMKMFNV